MHHFEPQFCRMMEKYVYRHEVGDGHLLEFKSNEGEISIGYTYDGHLHPDFRKAARGGTSATHSSIAAGFFHLVNPRSPRKAVKAQPLRIPAVDLHDKLCRCDTATLRHAYDLSEPKWIPVRIEGRILDETPLRGKDTEYFEAHEFTDNLELILDLDVSLPPEILRCSLGLYRRFQEILSGKVEARIIRLDAAALGRNKQEIGKAISELAGKEGGVLAWGLGAGRTIVGLEESEQDLLAAATQEIALDLANPVPVWPYPLRIAGGKDILLVEVPPLHKGKVRREAAANEDGQPVWDDAPTWVEISGIIRKGPSRITCFLNGELEQLPEIQAGMANSVGGHIIFGVRNHGLNRPGEIIGYSKEELLKMEVRILSSSHKGLPKIGIEKFAVQDRWILVQTIPSDLKEIYRNGDKFPVFDGEKVDHLERKKAMSLHRERREGTFKPLFAPPKPILRALSLSWMPFPGDASFNPETGMLEWRNIEMRQRDRGRYRCTLRVGLEQTRGLLAKGKVLGTAKVVIEDMLISGASLFVFDSLGKLMNTELEAKTEIVSEIRLELPAILRRRPYFPVRRFSLPGIKPTVEKVRDIVRALNDSGIILDEGAVSDYRTTFSGGIILTGRKHTDEGITHIHVKLAGQDQVMQRQLKVGVLTDNKQVDSGILEVTFQAATEDSHQGSSDRSHRDVAGLFNEVIANIKRRFEYLKAE